MLAQSNSTLSPGNVWDIQWFKGREIKEVSKSNKVVILGDFTHLYFGRSTGTKGLNPPNF